MARNRDNRPELDYEELRELHERFKSRTRPARSPQASDASAEDGAPMAPRAVRQQPRPSDMPEPAAVEEPVDAPVAEPVDLAPEPAPPDDFYDEDERYDDDDEGDDEGGNPNPFGSILSFLSKLRGSVGGRLLRRSAGDGEYEDYDSDDYDEEFDGDSTFHAAEAEAVEPDAPVAPAPAEAVHSADVAEEEPPVDEPYDVFDRPEMVLPNLATGEPELAPADYDDEDDPEDDDEEGEPSNAGSRFSKFLSLFIERADDFDEEEDVDADDALFDGDEDSAIDMGGEKDMQEPRKVSTEMTELMAEGLGERSLSRKERRELEMRQQRAEEAAAEQRQIIEAPEPIEPIASVQSVDEPTREFRPISREQFVLPVEAPISLFDDEDDEVPEVAPLSKREQRKAERLRRKEARKAELDEDDDDDYDDEEEAPAPKKRDRKAVRRDEYEDDDDYDDYEDDDDYDDEPRRGRRRRHDDDYDDYDDDDYDDDDEDRPSFGRYLTGFFKTLLRILVVLVILILALNILHALGKTTIVTSLRSSVRDWSPEAFDVLFPLAKEDEPSADLSLEAELPAPEGAAADIAPAAPEAPIS